MTAGIALYRCQALPLPWSPRTSIAPPLPLIVYGASSSLGCFAIKLARASNIHPIIAICGSSSQYVSTLLDTSKGDTVIDYRPGVEAMKAAVKEALGPLEAFHALDAISSNGTWVPLAQMVSPDGGRVSVVSGANAYNEADIPAGVEIKYVYVGTAHYGAYVSTMPKQPADKEAVESAVEFAYVFFRYIARLLAKGKFEGHPYTVVPGGLGGVERGLQMLKAGEVRGKKLVYRIEETEGLGG
jgi:NADPH2:quinone reductase